MLQLLLLAAAPAAHTIMYQSCIALSCPCSSLPQATQQQGGLAAALEEERSRSASRLAEFEAEVARLTQGVGTYLT